MTDLLRSRAALDAAEQKWCCSALYENELVQMLLGESFHPGGMALTDRLAELTRIDDSSTVLDIASGRGTTAMHITNKYGCTVTGVDLSESNVERARQDAKNSGLAERVSFQVADAESLPFDDKSFDVVLCECSLCTFPAKAIACSEMYRVLAPTGRVGISDVILDGTLPSSLDSVLALAACIADAESIETYAELLADAGFDSEASERHDDAIRQMLEQIRAKLVGAQLLVGTGQMELDGFDLGEARSMLRDAEAAVADGRLGYGIVVGARSQEPGSRV